MSLRPDYTPALSGSFDQCVSDTARAKRFGDSGPPFKLTVHYTVGKVVRRLAALESDRITVVLDRGTMNAPSCLVLFSFVAVCHPPAGLTTANAESNADQRALLESITQAVDVHAPERDWQFIVIHHSATDSGSVESIHREHRSRRDRSGNPWLGIGYHFVIGNGEGMADGEISSTFRWKQQLHGAHSGSLQYNDCGVGICLIGNFEESSPSRAQLDAVTELIKHIAKRHQIPASAVVGHRHVRATACPGRHFPLREIVEKVQQDVAIVPFIHPHSYFPEYPGQF